MRRPALDEAVAHLVDALTDQYRRECIRYWRERYGDDFAKQVRAKALKRLGRNASFPDSRKPATRAGT